MKKRLPTILAAAALCVPYIPMEAAAEQTHTFRIADAIVLHKWLAGLPGTQMLAPETYDCNQDGCLNAADLTLLKQQLMYTVPQLTITDPVAPVATPLHFDSAEALLAACAEDESEDYPEVSRPYYQRMFRTIRQDGAVYGIAEDPDITVLQPEDITICPSMQYEDTGLFCHVEYGGDRYLVMLYYADREILAQSADMGDYLRKRYGWEPIPTGTGGACYVPCKRYDENGVSASAFFDENNYYTVIPQTTVTQATMEEFLSHLHVTIRGSLNGETPHPAAQLLFLDSDDGCAPKNPQRLALHCQTVYAPGEIVRAEVMMGDHYRWNEQYEGDMPVYDTYGVNGQPEFLVCAVDGLRYEPLEHSDVIINGTPHMYHKLFTREDMADLDYTDKARDLAAYHHETVELDFSACRPGSAGYLSFDFYWQYLDPPNPDMPREGSRRLIAYYTGERGTVLAGDTTTARRQYEALFSAD